MDLKQQRIRKIAILIMGLLAYGIMLVMAVLFYKERVVMCDAAFQLFSIVKDHHFAIQINRFGAACTQVFPLLATRLGADINTVTMVYSLSFPIFYCSGFLGVLLGLKNERIALVILLFNTLMVRHSFFWIQCEFVQGAVLTLFFLALTESVMRRASIPRWYYPVAMIFIVTIVYFYPLLLFVMLFGFGFFILEFRHRTKFLLSVLGTYLLIFVCKIFFHSNFYDQQSMNGIKNIIAEFPHYFQLNSFKNFYRYVVNDYYLLVIFWLITAIYLLRSKRVLHALLMTAFLFGVCFLINVNYKLGVDQFYLESQYLILVIFVGFPFAYFVLSEQKWQLASLLFVLGAVGLSLIRIQVTHKIYRDRVAYIRELVQESTTKRLMPKDKVRSDILRFTWGISFEAWLLSNIELNETRSVVYEEQAGQFDYLLGDAKMFITQMGLYPYKDLDEQYFRKDSLSFYRKY